MRVAYTNSTELGLHAIMTVSRSRPIKITVIKIHNLTKLVIISYTQLKYPNISAQTIIVDCIGNFEYVGYKFLF